MRCSAPVHRPSCSPRADIRDPVVLRGGRALRGPIPALRERDILVTYMQRVAGPVMADTHGVDLAYARGPALYVPERMAAAGPASCRLPDAC